MATEVISNHHHRHQMELVVSSSPSDEDVSTSSTDVEMLLMPREKSSQDHSQDQVSTGVLVLTGPGSISTVGTVVDGEKNIEPGSQKPVQHQHYHYHYFYHVDPNNGGSGGPIPVTAISKSANPELMITAPSDHDQGDDSSSSSASSSVPSSPITPIPTSGDASPLLSSQNTSALVRTISNGSTFGPIIPNWPLFPPHHLTQSSSLSQVSQVQHHHDSKFESQVESHNHSRTTSEPLNLSNNKNITSECNNPSGAVILNTANSTSSTTSPTSLHLNLSIPNHSTDSHQTNPQSTSPSLMINPVLPTINPTSNSDQSTVPVSSSSPTSVAVVPVSVPRPVIRPTSTTTTILATAIPVEPALPDRLDLPLAFGDSFVLTSQIEASNLYRCVDTKTLEEYCVKVVLSRDYTDFCAGHHRMDGHEGINQIQKIIVGRKHCFILFGQSYGDLHTYVRMKRRLREPEVMPLFQQIVQIVADCHKNGIILRDLKLRKFIFSNKERTQLKLETLEGASLFEDDDDTLADKHGCPAYVSPEILYSNSYSGMLADCWSLGVILYTMLVGRYPFHDTNPSVVFYKIRRGTYHIPENLTRHAKCLIRNLVRIDPNERLTAEDALAHRWFRSGRSQHVGGVWLKPHRTGGGHHHTLSAAAAAAAINHHHHHHHHHHTSSSSNPSTPSLVPSTNSNSSNSRHPMSSSPYNESFNDQSMDAMQSSSGVVPTSPMIARTRSSVSTSSLPSNNPLINNQTNPNNSGPVRYTALLSTAASQFLNSNPETRNNIRNNNNTRTSSSSSSPPSPGVTNLGLANPFAFTSHSINNSTSVSSTPSTSSSSICCHYLASMGDQLVPDLSPNDSNEEVEEVVVEPMMSD